MTFSNNPNLRRYLMDGGLAHLAVFASFEFPAETFDGRLSQVRAQHPYLDEDEAAARAAYRMLAAQGKRHKPTAKIKKRLGIRFWIIVAAIVIGGLLAGYFCAAHAEPTPQQMQVIRNAMRGVSLLPMPQQSSGVIVQFRNGGSTLATRPAGLVVFDCGTNMSCSFSGSTFTLTSSATGATAWSAITAGTNAGQSLLVGNGSTFGPTGSGTITSTAFTPAGTLNNCVKWGSGGTLADAGAVCGGGAPAFTSITTGTNTTATMTVGTGGTLTFSGTGVLNADRVNGVEFTNGEGLGKIPIGQGDGTAVWADPLVQGLTAHDAAGSTTNPVAIGGFASAAAPADVSTDVDIVRGWFLRNGAQATVLTAAGALVGGDAANGLDVDVTRVTGTVTVSATNLDIRDLTATDVVTVTDGAGALNVVVDSGTITANAGTNLNTSALALEAGGNLAAAATSLAVIDDWDESDRAKVNPIAGQAGVQGGAGTVTALTQRIALATDANSVKVTDGTDTAAVTAGGELSVNCGNCAGSGASAIDDTAFTAASDDVAPAGFLHDTTPPSITDGRVGLATMDSSRRVLVNCAVGCGGSSFEDSDAFTFDTSNVTPIAAVVDDTATDTVAENSAGTPRMTTNRVLMVDLVGTQQNATAIKVDGSAVTQPVSGTITVGTFPDNEPINVAQMNGVAVTMGNGASGTGVQRVTLANDSTGVLASVGSITTSMTPGTAAANLGKAEDATHSSADTGVMALAVRDDYPPAATASATGEYQPQLTDEAGATYVRTGGSGTGSTAPWTGYLNCDNTAIYDASTNGSTQLVALTSSQTIYVCGYQISQSTTTAVSVNLRYGTGSNCATSPQNITPSYPLQAATSTGPIGMVVMTPGFTGLKTAASNALCINTNAAVSVQAIVWYAKF